MSDLIDRQSAIDALSEGAMINYQAAGHNNGLVKAIDVIKGLPLADQWIPCSERMPEIDETVLITIKEKYDGDKEYYYHTDVADHLINDGWLTFNDWDEGQEIHIIAWMPLPEPWKGEEK